MMPLFFVSVSKSNVCPKIWLKKCVKHNDNKDEARISHECHSKGGNIEYENKSTWRWHFTINQPMVMVVLYICLRKIWCASVCLCVYNRPNGDTLVMLVKNVWIGLNPYADCYVMLLRLIDIKCVLASHYNEICQSITNNKSSTQLKQLEPQALQSKIVPLPTTTMSKCQNCANHIRMRTIWIFFE